MFIHASCRRAIVLQVGPPLSAKYETPQKFGSAGRGLDSQPSLIVESGGTV